MAKTDEKNIQRDALLDELADAERDLLNAVQSVIRVNKAYKTLYGIEKYQGGVINLKGLLKDVSNTLIDEAQTHRALSKRL